MADSFETCMHRGVTLLREARFSEAERTFRQAVVLDDTRPLAFFHLGLARHRQGLLTEAVGAYEQALALDAAMLPALNNLGLALLDSASLKRAIQSFEEVLRIDPSHVAATYNLGRSHQLLEDYAPAIEQYARTLSLNPAHVLAASNLAGCLLETGRVEEAKRAAEQAMRISPTSAAVAHYTLGRIHYRQGLIPEACVSFRTAIQAESDYVDAHRALAEVLRERHESHLAEGHYRKVLSLNPDCLVSIAGLAVLYEQSGDDAGADEMLRRGLAISPMHPYLNLVAARRERSRKQLREAIARLIAVLAAGLDKEFRGVYHLELGQLYDALNETAQAAENWQLGNALHLEVAQSREIAPARFVEQANFLNDRILQYDAVDPLEESPDSTQSPVFAVGFPRSGTTLLNRMLDNHPDFVTVEEKPTLLQVEVFMNANRERFAQGVASITQKDAGELRQIYFNAVREHCPDRGSRCLVDKFPLNTFKLPLILRLFPRAKIIFSARHPCDVCLSCYMQNFEINSAMANFFTLEDAARLYVKSFAVWQRCLQIYTPAHHVVRYEELVGDFEGQARRIVTFLESAWDETVLSYDLQAKNTWLSTPSYQQVRQPIYQDAKFRWLKYRKLFDTTLPILEPVMNVLGYTV